MIQIGSLTLDLSDPLILAALALGLALLLVLILLAVVLSRAGRQARTAELLARQMGGLGQTVQGLSDGQQQLFGGLTSVTEAQAQSQSQTLALMEARLANVTEAMTQNLANSARNTAQSLGELQQRLKTIDKAQENITRLSGGCAVAAGYPLEQADPWRLRRDPAS